MQWINRDIRLSKVLIFLNLDCLLWCIVTFVVFSLGDSLVWNRLLQRLPFRRNSLPVRHLWGPLHVFQKVRLLLCSTFFSNHFIFSNSGQIKSLKWTTFTWSKTPFVIWKCDLTEKWRTTLCKRNVAQLWDFSTNLNLRFKKEMDPLLMPWRQRLWLDSNKALLIKSCSKPMKRQWI